VPPCSPIVFEAQDLFVDLDHREDNIDGDRVHFSKTGILPAAFLDSLQRAGTCSSADSAEGAGPDRQSETRYPGVPAGQLRHKPDDATVRPRLSSPYSECAAGLLSMRHNSGEQ
jgi:hypothetical protein